MDMSGYLNGTRQANQTTLALQSSIESLTQTSALASAALNRMIPIAAFSGIGKFSALAASTQSELAGLAGAARITGQNFTSLERETNKLARTFPVGNAEARQLTANIQSMGVVGKGSEKQIAQLGGVFIKLGAATGSSASQIGQQMVNLGRAFGDEKLNPKRMQDMANSVVALQDKLGGSAASITAFAQSISPFARQAGISEKATLGIAGAFSRLGDDSNSAATAVNKVLSDITRSVRDGGPQMLKYANIVGMSADQFSRLAKTNPTEALKSVTAALGKPGAKSQRDLESLGLDGIRTQKALNELTQSGGLNKAIDTSINADKNTLNDASGPAMEGFNASLAKLRASSEQVAEAFGTPMLKPLTAFANMLGNVAGGLAKVAGSGPGSKVLEGAAIFGVARTLTGRGIKGAAAAGLGRAVFNSGTARATRAGLTEKDNSDLMPEELDAQLAEQAALKGPTNFRKSMKAQRQIKDRQYAKDLMENSDEEMGTFSKTNRRAYGAAGGTHFTEMAPKPVEPAPQPKQGEDGRWRLNGKFASAPVEPEPMPEPEGKQGTFLGRMGRRGSVAFAAYKGVTGASYDLANAEKPQDVAGEKRKADPIAKALSLDVKGVVEGAKKKKKGDGGEEDTRSFGTRLKEAGKGLHAAGKAFDKEAQNVAKNGGGMNRAFNAIERNAKGAARSLMSMGKTGGKMGIGLASEALGSPLVGIAGAVTVGTMLWQRHKDSQEKSKEEDKAIQGSGITASIDGYNEAIGHAQQSTKTMADEMLNATAKLRKIRVPNSDKDATTVSGDDIADAAGRKVIHNYQGSDKQVAAEISGQSVDSLSTSQLQAMKLDLLAQGKSEKDTNNILGRASKAGGPIQAEQAGDIVAAAAESTNNSLTAKVSDKSKENLSVIAQNIAQQYDQDKDHYDDGGKYAESQRAKSMQMVMDQARSQGNVPQHVIDYLDKQFKGQLGDGVKTDKKAGDVGFDGTEYIKGQNLNVLAPAKGPGSTLKNIVEGDNRNYGDDPAVSLFDERNTSSDAQKVQNILPGSAKSINEAVSAIIAGGKKAGASFEDIAESATKAAANLDRDTPEAQALMLAAQRSSAMAQQTAPTQGAALGIQINSGLSTGAISTDNPATEAERQAGAQSALDGLNQYKGMMAQRLMAQQSYEISSQRSWRNYNLQTKNSETDYFDARKRNTRDFALQMKRLSEDAAKSMYDPYKRAGVEAIWDGRSLLENMAEQQARLRDQESNLNKARKAGLNNQTIQTLGLADSSHQQQLAELLQNQQNGDPALFKALNKSVASRIQASGTLAKDPGEAGLARTKEDRAQAIKDQDVERKKQIDRGRDAQKQGLADMAEDMHRAQLAMTTDFTKLQAAMNRLNAGQTVDFKSLMSNTMTDTEKEVKAKGVSIAQAYQNALGELAYPGSGTNSGPGAPATPGPAPATTHGRSVENQGGATAGAYVEPISGAPVTSGFGPRVAPKAGASKFHEGIDYGAAIGTAVHAAFDGVVKDERTVGGYGNLLVIDHGGGRSTRYGHLSQFVAGVGDKVQAGETVALSGNTGNSTGPHLHFETRENGVAQNPMIDIASWSNGKVGTAAPDGGGSSSKMELEEEDGSQVTHIKRLMTVAYNTAIDALGGASGGGTKGGGLTPAMASRFTGNPGGNVVTAKTMAAKLGWTGKEWEALYALWQQESGFSEKAGSPAHAYGIPQALPGSKMSSFGPDWMTNPATQIGWGLDYIRGRYGDPIAAENHKHATDSRLGSHDSNAQPGGWYGNGGIFTGAQHIGIGERGPEAVIPMNEMGVDVLSRAMTKASKNNSWGPEIKGHPDSGQEWIRADRGEGRISQGQAKAMLTQRTYITYDNSSHNYDHSTKILGPVTVKANHPAELGHELAMKRRSDNLTSTPTRRK